MITRNYYYYFFCIECCAVLYNYIHFAYNSPTLMAVSSRMLYVRFLKTIVPLQT